MNEKLKISLYEALRSNQLDHILPIIQDPQVKKYLSDLTSGNEIHEHIIRLLDGKLDAGQKSLVCAIGAILWPDGIKKLPAKVTLCRAVPEVINTENKLMLYTFTNIAKNFKKSKNISSDIMEYIFSYALLFSKEDIKYISYEDRSFQKLRPPL